MEALRRSWRGVVLVILAAANAFIWYAAIDAGRSSFLMVAFLDLGDGDAVFVRSPDGRVALIDAGADANITRALSSFIPFYDRAIDALILTNFSADRSGGLSDVVRSYRIGKAFEPDNISSGAAPRAAFESALISKGVPIMAARRGTVVDLGGDAKNGGVTIEFLSPDRVAPKLPATEGSLVARISYGATSFLLMSDLPQNMERYLVSLDGAAIRADVLGVGHAGAKTSTSPELLAAVTPSYAVVSVSAQNRYHYPATTTLDALRAAGAKVFTTASSGTVVFESDGKTVSLLR